MDRFFLPVVAWGSGWGSVYGAYVCTDPSMTEVRFRDAVIGGIVGGAFGAAAGGLAVAAYPLTVITPLVVIPYIYNRSKMETK